MKQTNKNTYTDNGRIKEECGVFGIFNPHGEDAASTIYYGLSSLQHRGQESCGIAVSDTSGPKGNMETKNGTEAEGRAIVTTPQGGRMGQKIRGSGSGVGKDRRDG